jgi:hypothetical protein
VALSVVRLVRVEGAPEAECRAFAQCLSGQIAHGPARDPAQDHDREVPDIEQLELTLSMVEAPEEGQAAVAKAADGCDKNWRRLYRFAG